MTVCPLNKFIGILVLTLGFGVALWGSDAKPPCTVALESVRTPTGKSRGYLKAQIFKALVVDRPILFKSRFFAAAFEVALLKAQYLKVVGYDTIFEDSSFWSIQFNKNAHRQVFEDGKTLKSVLNPIKSHELGKYEFSKHIVETLFAFRKSRGIDESVPERAATVSSLAQSFNFQSVDLLEETLALLKQIEVDPEATAAFIELVQVNLAEYIDFYFKQVAFNNYNSIFDNRSWEIQSEIKWGRRVVTGSTLGLGAGAAIPFLSTLGLIAPSANNPQLAIFASTVVSGISLPLLFAGVKNLITFSRRQKELKQNLEASKAALLEYNPTDGQSSGSSKKDLPLLWDSSGSQEVTSQTLDAASLPNLAQLKARQGKFEIEQVGDVVGYGAEVIFTIQNLSLVVQKQIARQTNSSAKLDFKRTLLEFLSLPSEEITRSTFESRVNAKSMTFVYSLVNQQSTLQELRSYVLTTQELLTASLAFLVEKLHSINTNDTPILKSKLEEKKQLLMKFEIVLGELYNFIQNASSYQETQIKLLQELALVLSTPSSGLTLSQEELSILNGIKQSL